MRMKLLIWLIWVLLLNAVPRCAMAGTSDLLKDARDALAQRDAEKALGLADGAIASDKNNAEAYLLRGSIYEVLNRHKEAIADLDKTIQLDPKIAVAYNHRGSEHFKLGHIEQSIKDFDKYLELRPKEAPGHWQRGISYYYAGRFDEGRKQFEAYQGVDQNDVENVVWRYLCMARVVGVENARQAMLKVGEDKRVPMMEIYALCCGRAKPTDVLTRAQADQPAAKELNQRLFYAHLYLGLYYEAAGDRKQTLEHLSKAAQRYKVDGYMWDVARVHLEILRKARKS
jgi:lipoprotein NlpI